MYMVVIIVEVGVAYERGGKKGMKETPRAERIPISTGIPGHETGQGTACTECGVKGGGGGLHPRPWEESKTKYKWFQNTVSMDPVH